MYGGSKCIIQVGDTYKPPPLRRSEFTSLLLCFSFCGGESLRCDVWLLVEDKGRAGEEEALPVFVVGLWCNLGVVGVFFFFSRPLGHALCISEEKDPPHPSCACVCVRLCVCVLPYTAHSLCSLTPMAI